MLGFSPIGSVPLADFSLIQSQARVQLNFPPDPSIGDVYTKGSAQYIFTGTKWKLFAKKYRYSGAAPANAGNATQLDLSAGNFFDIILDEQTTVSFANPPASGFAKKFQVKLSILSDYADISSYDLANASYDNVSFSVAAQDGVGVSLVLNNDGTKMYILGGQTDRLYQYTLSTAFDLSTASYSSVLFNFAAQDGTATGLAFNNDGTKMYISGFATRSIYQYSLSTAFDISTASYDSVSFNVSAQTGENRDIAFNNDGTKMYIVDPTSDAVYQYSLSTAFNLSTASYDSVSFSVTAQDTTPLGIDFNSDGTKMYIIGLNSDAVHQYSLSTAFNLSTASYDSVSFSVVAQDNGPTSSFFSNNGAKMYVLGITSDAVYQYTTGSSNTTPTVTWPNSITWETGSAPTLPALGQTDVLEFYTSDGGTTYYGKLKEDNVS